MLCNALIVLEPTRWSDLPTTHAVVATETAEVARQLVGKDNRAEWERQRDSQRAYGHRHPSTDGTGDSTRCAGSSTERPPGCAPVWRLGGRSADHRQRDRARPGDAPLFNGSVRPSPKNIELTYREESERASERQMDRGVEGGEAGRQTTITRRDCPRPPAWQL